MIFNPDTNACLGGALTAGTKEMPGEALLKNGS
jgi:hypothetical protein